MRISLAGQWERSMGGKPIDTVPVPGSYPPVGACVLTRRIELPEAARRGAGRWFLCTEGVLSTAEFTVNGQAVGTAGAYVPYRFELPAGMLAETNVVSARVRDITEAFGPTPGRRFDGGLIRDIYLEHRPAAFMDSVSLSYEFNEDRSLAMCRVLVEVDGATEGEIEISLVDGETGYETINGAAGANEPLEFGLPWPLLWSPDKPHLYTLVAHLGKEEVRGQVGFRQITIEGSDFFLNGERLLLKGVCRHEFTTEYGYTVPEEVVRHDLARTKHAGFNYVRLVHSPQAACVARIAAEIGLLVSEEPGACFHDLSDPALAEPALESLRRLVRRDRNCPAVFAWLIYNECPPNAEYGKRAAEICRELQPGCLVSCADCSGDHEGVKRMTEAGQLSYYGINRYTFNANEYVELMRTYDDLPLVFTEWGGWWTQSNRGVMRAIGQQFVEHARASASPRVAGFSFWVWQDYEEYSRPEPWSVEGVTIEGVIDQRGRPKPDLQWLSEVAFAMGREAPLATPKVEVLLAQPSRPEEWQAVPYQPQNPPSLVEMVEAPRRRFAYALPQAERLRVAGLEFACFSSDFTLPLLLGPEQEEVVIPVYRPVRAVAILGHVALCGGYPSSDVHSVHHRDAEPVTQFGEPASHYEFVFDEETVTVPLQHGVHILRANDICRWWPVGPRAPETSPALRAVLHPSFEVLRYDLWEHDFGETRPLQKIRWRRDDGKSVQGMLAVSVRG